MTTDLDSSIVMLGLKGSGKTNFLVALDVALESPVNDDALVHSEHSEDREYLHPLRQQWLKGLELSRTARKQPTPHQLLVRHPATDTKIKFHLPDLAGEMFDSHFATRSFPNDLCARLEAAPGLFLFIHVDTNPDHETLESQAFKDQVGEAPTTSAPVPWSFDKASPQTKLVDLMQFVRECRSPHSPLPIAVIISAWDLIENMPDSINLDTPRHPTAFLNKQWPLLSHYLDTQRDFFRFKVFGVSARGGGTTDEDILRLTSLENPNERIILIDDSLRTHDLSRPVRWVMGLLNPV